MPQLPYSTANVPVSYPLYLDIGKCGSNESRVNLDSYEKHMANMIDLNMFYENLFASQSPESLNYYLRQTYRNNDKNLTSKSFSIESILGFGPQSKQCHNYHLSPLSEYSCKEGAPVMASSPNCLSIGDRLLNTTAITTNTITNGKFY